MNIPFTHLTLDRAPQLTTWALDELFPDANVAEIRTWFNQVLDTYLAQRYGRKAAEQFKAVTMDQVNAAIAESNEQLSTAIAQRLTATPKPKPKLKPVDPDIDYRIEYQLNAAAFLSEGITEDEFVLSRRIDDGLETLELLPDTQ